MKEFLFFDWEVNTHLDTKVKKIKNFHCLRIFGINDFKSYNPHLFRRTFSKSSSSVDFYDFYVETGKNLTLQQFIVYLKIIKDIKMSFNLPTGPGLSICNTRSLAIVKMNGKEPIDGGAGKIKKLDNEILNMQEEKFKSKLENT